MSKKKSGRGAIRNAPEKAEKIQVDWSAMWRRLPVKKWAYALLVVTVIWIGYSVKDYVIQWVDRPLARIEVQGLFRYMDKSALQTQLDGYLGKSFLGLKLQEVKTELEANPWIYRVAIRRAWPDAFYVRVEEQLPVARWNKSELLNGWGERFEVGDTRAFSSLPLLSGGDALAEDILRRFVAFNSKLSESDLVLRAVIKEPRGAWTLELANGIRVLLGRQDEDERLQRFLDAWKIHLNSEMDKIKDVDARYTNGVAVSWRQSVAEDQKDKK